MLNIKHILLFVNMYNLQLFPKNNFKYLYNITSRRYKMDFKNDGVIGNLPKNINKEVPTPKAM